MDCGGRLARLLPALSEMLKDLGLHLRILPSVQASWRGVSQSALGTGVSCQALSALGRKVLGTPKCLDGASSLFLFYSLSWGRCSHLSARLPPSRTPKWPLSGLTRKISRLCLSAVDDYYFFFGERIKCLLVR